MSTREVDFQFGASLDVDGDVILVPEITTPRVWIPRVWVPGIPGVWVPEVCLPVVGCSGGYYLTDPIPGYWTGGYWTGGDVLVPEQGFSFDNNLFDIGIDQTVELIDVEVGKWG